MPDIDPYHVGFWN